MGLNHASCVGAEVRKHRVEKLTRAGLILPQTQNARKNSNFSAHLDDGLNHACLLNGNDIVCFSFVELNAFFDKRLKLQMGLRALDFFRFMIFCNRPGIECLILGRTTGFILLLACSSLLSFTIWKPSCLALHCGTHWFVFAWLSSFKGDMISSFG